MPNTDNSNQSLMLWIVWSAQLFTLVVFLFALQFFYANAQMQMPDPEFIARMRLGLIGTAIVLVAIIFGLRRTQFFKPLAEGKTRDIETLRAQYFATCMLSWGLCEAIAIFGFLLSFLSRNSLYYPSFALPSVLLFVVFRPQVARVVAEFNALKSAPKTDEPIPETEEETSKQPAQEADEPASEELDQSESW